MLSSAQVFALSSVAVSVTSLATQSMASEVRILLHEQSISVVRRARLPIKLPHPEHAATAIAPCLTSRQYATGRDGTLRRRAVRSRTRSPVRLSSTTQTPRPLPQVAKRVHAADLALFQGFVGIRSPANPRLDRLGRLGMLGSTSPQGAGSIVPLYLRIYAKHVAQAALLISCLHEPCEAQVDFQWADELFGTQPGRRYERPSRPVERLPRKKEQSRKEHVAAPSIESGGPRPDIKPQAPPIVSFPYNYPRASVVIDTAGRKLYYVLDGGRAYAYAVSVGREGFTWTGVEQISRKQPWPDWYPPEEMRQRDPKLPEKMTGGVRNPLGALALYLGKTLYRIHGTNDVRSIGRAQSSGCFRMLNSAVLHLSTLVEVGTPVAVVHSLHAALGAPKS
jgi:lipoprotein-anchoring transpeptidase ErfK/SrfK